MVWMPMTTAQRNRQYQKDLARIVHNATHVNGYRPAHCKLC